MTKLTGPAMVREEQLKVMAGGGPTIVMMDICDYHCYIHCGNKIGSYDNMKSGQDFYR